MTIIEKLGITPGPWMAKEVDTFPVDSMGEVDVFKIYKDEGDGFFEHIANAFSQNVNVLSAAPEMLGALIEYCLLMEGGLLEASVSVNQVRTMDSLYSKYVAIIEKIRGETWEEIKALIK